MLVGFGDLSQLGQMGAFDKANLQPIIDSFPGSTYQEKLVSGYEQARTVLSKYTSTFTYDENAAADLFNQIDTWFNTHQDMIAEYMKQPATATVPQQIALVFDAKKAQQFIVAGFAAASRGLGPWASGFVAKNAGSYPGLTQNVATDDANARLGAFATLIKLDTDGVLRQMFIPPTGSSGFGALPVLAWVAIVAIVSLVAAVALYATFTKLNEQNNALQAQICQYAADHGDTATVQKCAEAVAGKSLLGLGEALNKLAIFAGAGLLLYVGVVHVLPAMKRQQ